MINFSKMTRTDVSAMASVALFGMTILVSAVGPAGAQQSILINEETASPSVSPTPNPALQGYRA